MNDETTSFVVQRFLHGYGSGYWENVIACATEKEARDSARHSDRVIKRTTKIEEEVLP